MSFCHRIINLPPANEMGRWPNVLLGCVNKVPFTRRQVRLLIAWQREEFGNLHREYFCGWCGCWHAADYRPDRKRERKRRKTILAMRREYFALKRAKEGSNGTL